MRDTVTVKLTVDASRFVAEMNRAAANFRRFGQAWEVVPAWTSGPADRARYDRRRRARRRRA